MLPGWLHDPARECSDEEIGSITMYYTWREKRRLNSLILNKSISKVLFSFTVHGHSHWFVLRRKLSQAKTWSLGSNIYFFTWSACWFVCYRRFEYVLLMNLNRAKCVWNVLIQMRTHAQGTQRCSVNVKLWDVCILNYFFNWLSDPVNEWRVSALKGQLSKCLWLLL